MLQSTSKSIYNCPNLIIYLFEYTLVCLFGCFSKFLALTKNLLFQVNNITNSVLNQTSVNNNQQYIHLNNMQYSNNNETGSLVIVIFNSSINCKKKIFTSMPYCFLSYKNALNL